MAIQCNSTNNDKKILLNALKNESIQFGTYIPDNSPFISMGRKIKITGPDAALKLVKYGDAIIPDLIGLLKDEKRDWAAHVLLSSILGGDAVMLSVYAPDYKKWQNEQKERDVKNWENRLKSDS